MNSTKNFNTLSLYVRTYLLGFALCVARTTLADYTCTTNGYTFWYTLNDAGQATITENKDDRTFSGEELVIPARIDGHEVVSIGMNAFNQVANSYYFKDYHYLQTELGKAFVEEGLSEIGRAAFYTEGKGWECVCVPPSVDTFSGAFCFRFIGRLYWTIDSVKLNIGQFSFSSFSGQIHIIATTGVPNMLHDSCSGWDNFGSYFGDTRSVYYKCKRSDYEAWSERGGAERFRGYVSENYGYGEKAVISFDSNGHVSTATYRQGSPYETFPDVVRLGYTFAGWHTEPYPEADYPDGILVSEYDAVTSPAETLYAQWTPLMPTWDVIGANTILYDGMPHEIVVVPTAPVEGVIVNYATTEEGPYSDKSPTMTEAGTMTVWYVLKAPDWSAITNSATLTILEDVARLDKNLSPASFTYDGTEHKPQVTLHDKASTPNLTVKVYSAGDIDGDGALTQNDVLLLQRFNAWQKLGDDMKKTFASYELKGDALKAADVNGDEQVDENDVTALQAKFSGYELILGTDYTVTYADNVNAGSGKAIVKGIGNYGGESVLEFTILPASFSGIDEPSDGKLSKFDASYVYNGEGHTMDTNALTSALKNTLGSNITITYGDGSNWYSQPPTYTNAGEHVTYYNVADPNYETFIHAARVTIAQKHITTTEVEVSYDPASDTSPGVSVYDDDVCIWRFVAPYSRGDANGDGILDVSDILRIEQYLDYLQIDDSLKPFFSEYDLADEALAAADFNNDGIIDETDTAALEESLHIPEENVDYTVTIGFNTVTITGIGNYTGEYKTAFRSPEIRNVTAKPRYPWNGKVDISFDVLGDETPHNFGLVAYWSFDGDTSDSTGNGHDLQTALGTPVPAEDLSGAADKAYAFDGKSYLNMKDADPFIVMTNFTISLWFKTPVNMSEHGTSRTNWNPGNDVVHAGFRDYLCVGVGLRVGTDGVAVVEHGGMYRPTVLEHKCELGETWHHVAVTVADNGGEMLYLDGKYIGTAEINRESLSGQHGNGTKAVCLDNGDNSGIGGGQWGRYTGSVDDVRVYNRALSADEIAVPSTTISRGVFFAKDLVGGTNIAMRTVYTPGGSVTNSTFNLAPGKYNFVWDADADLPDGFVGEQISVKVVTE